ncbi:ankyrin repeat-containing domain protein [Mycena capillaripes]|nr:ankyrin repeat-containing domain protein [Mycena capillaripes]
MARRVQRSFDHYGLHQAALKGDDDGVRHALRSGASVNDLDSSGRTAVMCAVAGENWQNIDASNASFSTPGHLKVVRTLLGDSQMSLFTLNAPQMAYRGVTPLGMSAWLNLGDAVRVLLEESSEYVSVDGTDVHGATPLMYAARDARLDVVQILLRHGARPDLGDGNHHTSVQFALLYPQILWLCETALRRHRYLESQSPDRNKIASNPDSKHLLHIASSALSPSRIFEPPPLSVFSVESTSRLTSTIIRSVISSDIPLLHSLLFAPSSQTQLYPSPPVLVNLPDTKGWSAIHYCAAVENPSIPILDALYCAGAVPLFTTHERWTPLHCFAQSAPRPFHDCPELRISLYQFINHLVYDLRTPLAARDKQDETCIHIAAEKGNSIEVLVLLLDCDTSGTVRELRNSRGLTALEVCKPEFRTAFGEYLENLRSGSSLSSYTIRPSGSATSLSSWIAPQPTGDADDASVFDDVDISASSEQLLVNLRLTSPSENHSATPFHLNFLDNLIREAADITAIVSAHYRTITDEATKDVQVLRKNADKMQMLLDRAYSDVEQAMQSRGLAPILPRKRCNRESEDSQATVVSCVEFPTSPVEAPDGDLTWPKWHDNFVLEGNKSSERIDRLRSPSVERLAAGDDRESKDGQIEPAKLAKRLSGTTKLKAWMKRKLLPDVVELPVGLKGTQNVQRKLEVILEQVENAVPPRSPVVDSDLSADAWMDGLLRTSHASLQAAGRDLDRIRECITSAEHFITIVDRSAARAERIVNRALKKREAAVAKLRLRSDTSPDDEFFVRPGQLSTKSSIASLSSAYSARSSCVSLAATLAENEDDDTRVIRRLLLRKIDTGAHGAQEQLEKGVNWLRTVKEIVRGAKKRAYI